VTQHQRCRIRVTVQQQTSSAGHKLSLVFAMVSPYPLALGAYAEQVEEVGGGNLGADPNVEYGR
jgi:hypothetical protein